MTSLHIVVVCLSLLTLTCIASLLQRLIKVPLPFLQIGVGVVAALPPINWQVPLDPETFFLLFLPLLLFGDGWRLPRRGLMSMPWAVFGHAVVLVLLTTAIGGYVLHWLVPEMPLSVAFAVGALVSPTDAVAVGAITRNLTVTHRMKHLLESEALLNDASGLVAMRLAIAATLSGSFSPLHAAGELLWVATVGILIGVGLSMLYHQIHRRVLVGVGDATLQTVLMGLLPFAAFALADEVGASGILAAVAAGIAASRLSLLEHAHYTARIMTGATWDVVSFCLNGLIFVLLGLQLPGLIGAGPSGVDLVTSHERLAILDEIALLTLALIVIRFVWVLASIGLSRLTNARRDSIGWRDITASSIAGARGVVTLAGALSIPLVTLDGTPFPYRDLAITVAVGVILLSLLIAAVGLPLLLRGRPAERESDAELVRARRVAIDAAINAIEKHHSGEEERTKFLISAYRGRSMSLDNPRDAEDRGAWRDIYRTALHAERRAIQKLRAADTIDDTVARQLFSELDLLEAALMLRPLRP
ncbi:Na+/H+ antiporter [Hyphomicrobium sp.]|jgi:CPA1 family monovalent cation:H+ antiporter|uniref:Na+/H+ antiporter n=1 Tax=Hyphomicrobium sp. TaxID=82 RepID=UPI003561D08F